MKIICPPGYHHNSFVATDAIGLICIMCPSAKCAKMQAMQVITRRAHWFRDCICTTVILLL